MCWRMFHMRECTLRASAHSLPTMQPASCSVNTPSAREKAQMRRRYKAGLAWASTAQHSKQRCAKGRVNGGSFKRVRRVSPKAVSSRIQPHYTDALDIPTLSTAQQSRIARASVRAHEGRALSQRKFLAQSRGHAWR